MTAADRRLAKSAVFKLDALDPQSRRLAEICVYFVFKYGEPPPSR